MSEKKLNSSKGGEARALSLTAERRSEIARKAVQARWSKSQPVKPKPVEQSERDKLPVAKHRGTLDIMDMDIPCYVLDNGQRVIGRTSATEMLTGITGGGPFEKTLGVQALKPFINLDLVLVQLVEFRIPEVEGTGNQVKGLPADLLIEICQGFVSALDYNSRNALPPDVPKMTNRQQQMALKASLFLSACAKVGLDALIDEATGYQETRERDALQFKLRAYLATEMRKWEKTFPDELWIEFGRLTNWKGAVTQRPKYWGHLVTLLIYEYLDPDVAQWLKENVPQPRKGRNYHLWLSEQYGLKKLVEHIWMVIGIARTCYDMEELKQKMKQMFGKGSVQLDLFLQVPVQASTMQSDNTKTETKQSGPNGKT